MSTVETVLVDKEDQRVLRITDSHGFTYIIKEGHPVIIEDEYNAYQLLNKIGLRNYIPNIFHFRRDPDKNVLVQEFIPNTKIFNLPFHKKKSFWLFFICQLARFVYVLEKNKIQHNDFHSGNILIVYDKPSKLLEVKVIDFETMVDYKDKIVYSRMIKSSSPEEYIRMGWSKKFHPGSDLNQIIGQLFEEYKNDIPKDIHDIFFSRVIKYDKEYPYAISEENPLTTGKAVLKLCKRMYVTFTPLKI